VGGTGDRLGTGDRETGETKEGGHEGQKTRGVRDTTDVRHERQGSLVCFYDGFLIFLNSRRVVFEFFAIFYDKDAHKRHGTQETVSKRGQRHKTRAIN
jgi:hypothetical protein